MEALKRAATLGIAYLQDEQRKRGLPVVAIENTSGLQPVGWAVLLLPYEPEKISKGGILIPETLKGRIERADQRAIVIAVGPQAWADEPHPRAAVGDKVMITKYAGMFITGPGNGKQYRMVNDKDIFCRITEEKHEVSYV